MINIFWVEKKSNTVFFSGIFSEHIDDQERNHIMLLREKFGTFCIFFIKTRPHFDQICSISLLHVSNSYVYLYITISIQQTVSIHNFT